MRLYKRFALVGFALVVVALSATGSSVAGEPVRHIVGAADIQAQIDRQAGQADADRQAIQLMLRRADVRQAAGAAGLDLERASAAASVLSGPSLEQLAAQARLVNASLVGGDGTVVISATALIIILLLIILLTR